MENELQSSYPANAKRCCGGAEKNTVEHNIAGWIWRAAQKRLMQMQKSLETRKQSLTDQLVKEQDDFNRDLKSRLDAFLGEYNKTHNYDYILSYSSGGSSILYANKQYDITKDVVDGMNATSKDDGNKKNK